MWRSFEIQKKNNTIQQDLETNYQNTVLNKHIPTALSCAFTEISGLRGCNYHVLHTSAALFSTWSSFFSCQHDELPLFFFSPANIAFSTEAESRKWKQWNTTSYLKADLVHLLIYMNLLFLPEMLVRCPVSFVFMRSKHVMEGAGQALMQFAGLMVRQRPGSLSPALIASHHPDVESRSSVPSRFNPAVSEWVWSGG